MIIKTLEAEKYITILGPFWDFLKEYDIEIVDPRERRELITNYIHSRHHS